MNLQPIDNAPLPPWFPSKRDLHRFFCDVLPFHHIIGPNYKIGILTGFSRVFPPGPCRVLDIGTGDGLMATAIGKFFPVSQVCGVDVIDRLHKKACLDFHIYDGSNLPYQSDEFDVAIANNVLHHVPKVDHSSLLREISRVTRSTIILKDHLADGLWSKYSLHLADWVGNVPFRGMTKAYYLNADEWSDLLAVLSFRKDLYNRLRLQRGLRNIIFPDANEIMIRIQKGKCHNGNQLK